MYEHFKDNPQPQIDKKNVISYSKFQLLLWKLFKKYIFKIENNNHLFLYKFIIAILDIFKSIYHNEFKVLQFLNHELL